jgi:hemolysin activation/secretion protein
LNFELPVTFFLTDSLLFVKPSYSKSLSAFDAKKDDRNLDKTSAKNQFDVFKIYANYSRDIKISDKKFALKSNLIWQHSRQSLYAIDRISMGGIRSVRGFKEGTISGDSGYGFRSEIVANLGDFDFMPLALKNFSLAPFYDYGHVESKYGNSSGRLAAAGFGLGFKKDGWKGEMIFSKVLSKAHLLGNNYHERGAVFFNLGYEVGFF